MKAPTKFAILRAFRQPEIRLLLSHRRDLGILVFSQTHVFRRAGFLFVQALLEEPKGNPVILFLSLFYMMTKAWQPFDPFDKLRVFDFAQGLKLLLQFCDL